MFLYLYFEFDNLLKNYKLMAIEKIKIRKKFLFFLNKSLRKKSQKSTVELDLLNLPPPSKWHQSKKNEFLVVEFFFESLNICAQVK